MHEDEHVEFGDFVPERLERRIVDEFAVELGGDHHALEAELMAAAGELFERRGAAERMRVRGADEAPRIVALGLSGFVVDEPRGFKIGAHAGGAGEPGRVDAGQLHHAHVLVEVVEQRMHRVARRTERIIVQDKPVARIVLDQFARREMVLEIDDHLADIPPWNRGLDVSALSQRAQARLHIPAWPISCPTSRFRSRSAPSPSCCCSVSST